MHALGVLGEAHELFRDRGEVRQPDGRLLCRQGKLCNSSCRHFYETRTAPEGRCICGNLDERNLKVTGMRLAAERHVCQILIDSKRRRCAVGQACGGDRREHDRHERAVWHF